MTAHLLRPGVLFFSVSSLSPRFPRPIARVALGAALLAAGTAIRTATEAHGGLLILDPIAAAAFVSGLLFGWAGTAGAVAATLAIHIARYGSGPSWLALASVAVLGLVASAVFRYLPGCGRRVPDLRAYGALLAAAAVGGLGYSALETL